MPRFRNLRAVIVTFIELYALHEVFTIVNEQRFHWNTAIVQRFPRV